MKKKRIAVMISPGVHKRLKKYCEDKGRLIEAFANDIVHDKLNDEGY